MHTNMVRSEIVQHVKSTIRLHIKAEVGEKRKESSLTDNH
jgi:hypothetical protein